jgi:cleavage stimulation factor subunit 2
MSTEQNIMDKSMRSVFVGNIPYEATEEKLKDIFSEVGPVLSLKLVFDRESGKPKGYGFCEYKDQETALSAMRNLNGYEIGGRTLRVDNACTEKSRMEMAALLQGPQVENPYGEHCDPEQAPEIITKTVASLPPEQMYELMKQMKLCIQNNPSEAREMLVRNPQLSYALLQAQVVMRIVDPATAVTFLYKANQMPPVLTTSSIATAGSQSITSSQSMPMPVPAPQAFGQTGDIDLRPVDPRLNRGGGGGSGVVPPMLNPSIGMDLDMRQMPMISGIDMNFGARNPSAPSAAQRPMQPAFPSDPRQRPSDPRQKNIPSAVTAPPLQRGNSIIPDSASDAEKAALIMQVLQLSDEQIAMLPPEQRTSILVLKEQIAKSTTQR